MSSKRETALSALATLLSTTFATGGAEFVRDPEKAPADNDAGNVIMLDGDTGEPTVSLSPVQYQWDHAVFVELSASGPDRTATVDALQGTLDTALKIDRTLGGTVIDCRVMQAPIIDVIDGEGTETLRAATVHIMLFYVSDSPIG